MNGTPDPIELLAFIESSMPMNSHEVAARWPDWSKLMDAALPRGEQCLSPEVGP